MTNIVDVFKIPVYRVSLDLNLKTMLTHCNYLRKIDKGMTRSNSGGFTGGKVVTYGLKA